MRWQGREIEEFDLDGALSRRPKLIIVDELAHTNAPESRHPKRWQDVEELLDARIDVWTALNIQHLESLADVVSRITGVTVRETVPDIVLRDADDIVLVDITSEDLIQRLKDGKVYLRGYGAAGAAEVLHPAQPDRAARDRAAPHGGAGRRPDGRAVAPGRDRRPVGDERAPAGLRRPRRAVDGRGARGEPARDRPQRELGGGDGRPAGRRRRGGGAADAALRLAQSLGAETTRLVGHDLPAEILGYAERENITQVVVGRSKAGFLGRLAGRSLSDALARRASLVGVHVVTGDKPREAPRRRRFAARSAATCRSARSPRQASVAVAVGVGEALDRWLRLPNLSMIFLIAVLLSAARFGVRAAIVAAVLSFLAYDFFFVPPYYQFTIAEPQEFFALVIFLAVASLVGWLAGRARDQERLARASAQATSSLFEFSRKLSGAATLDDILDTTTVYAHKTLRARGVVMLLPEDGELPLSAAWPPIDELDPGENGAARWAFDKSEPAGWKTGTLPNVRFQFRPLVTSRGVVGVCGFEPADRDAPISPTLEHGLNLILEQAAIAIDRALLVKDSVRTVGAGREREAARHAARLAVARPAHAAGGDHRRGDDAAQVRRRHGARAARRPARLDRRGERRG